jgi:hypothetical protein
MVPISDKLIKTIITGKIFLNCNLYGFNKAAVVIIYRFSFTTILLPGQWENSTPIADNFNRQI